MKHPIYMLLATISIAVFACSDSPSSPQNEEPSSSSFERSDVITISSSSGGSSGNIDLLSSSSTNDLINGEVCIFSGEEIGSSGLFACEEYTVPLTNIQAYKTECEEYGGSWESQCPSNEEIICVDEEEAEAKDMLIKIYADGVSCEDFGLKNAAGSEIIVSKGGACGPFTLMENVSISMCAEFPEFTTGTIKLSCAELEAPFIDNCPSSDLTCFNPDDEMIAHFYGEGMSSFKCQDFNMDDML